MTPHPPGGESIICFRERKKETRVSHPEFLSVYKTGSSPWREGEQVPSSHGSAEWMLYHFIFKRGAETQAVRQGDSPSLTAPSGGGSGLRTQTHSLGSWGPPLISATELLSVTWALTWSQVGGWRWPGLAKTGNYSGGFSCLSCSLLTAPFPSPTSAG